MEKSRQVERAEFRAEMKRGASLAKRKARIRKQKARESRPSGDSTLRIAAMRAVSRLSGFGRRRTARA